MIRRLFLIGCLLLPAVVLAGAQNEKVQSKLSVPERKQLESLAVLSPRSLAEIDRLASGENLRRQMADILALGHLGPGARKMDANGHAPIHTYLRKRFAPLKEHGLVEVGSLIGTAGAPVPVEQSRDAAKFTSWQKGSRVEVGDSTFSLAAMWPTGPLPSLCPAEGLTGPLVYVEDGGWEALQGLDLKGAIAIMDFQAGRRWATLASLGCQAVIAVEDNHVSRDKAERWFSNTPAIVPRFYINKEKGAELIKLARRKKYVEDGWEAVEGQPCTLKGGNIYEEVRYESPFVYLPPTDPITYTVRSRDLLERIGNDFAVSPDDLIALNGLEGDDLAPKRKLSIPGQDKSYEVKKNDLLHRIAQDYGVSPERLLAANRRPPEVLEFGQPLTFSGVLEVLQSVVEASSLDISLKPGTVLTIPNLKQSVVVLVPIDSVSVAPTAPHGAKMAANLALALTTLEHLATDEEAVRRKGVVFGFLDADSLGGRTSRSFAENILLWHNELNMRPKDDPAERIRRYRTTVEWLAGGMEGELDVATSQWLAEDWLNTRIENLRIGLAEQRVRLRNEQRKLSDRPQDRKRSEEINERLKEIDLIIWGKDARVKDGGLVDIRDRTITDTSLEWPQRAKRFFQRVPRTRQAAREKGMEDIALPELEERLKAELTEEAHRHHITTNNVEAIKDIYNAIHPAKDSAEKAKPTLAFQLDISDGSHSLLLQADVGQFRRKHPAGGMEKTLQDRYRQVLAYAAVQGGWDEDWLILTPDDAVDRAMITLQPTPAYPEFWAAGEVSLLMFSTQNDTKQKLDTPWDTLEKINLRNLSIQARSVMFLLSLGVENPLDSLPPTKIKNMPKFGRITGKVTEFNMRSGIDAQDPVPGSFVYYPATKDRTDQYSHNTATFRGSRRGILAITPLNGTYTLPLEDVSQKKRHVYAYLLDPARAVFRKVTDQGQTGSQRPTPTFRLLDGEETEKKLVLTEVYPRMVFPGVDPRNYQTVGEKEPDFEIIDVVRGGDPKHYALDAPLADFTEQDLDVVVLYVPEGSRVRLAVASGITTKLVLSGWVNPGNFKHKGNGYVIGSMEDPTARQTLRESMRQQAEVEAKLAGKPFDQAQWMDDWEQWYQQKLEVPGWTRNLSLPMTPLHIARDMLALAERRQNVYREFGIKDQVVGEAVERARYKYQRAEQAIEEHNYQAANGAAREAWGILVKSYVRIMDLGREAVFSVVVLMGLLLPASAFMEKLLIGQKGIVGKLVGTTVLFALGATFLNFFHPGFRISVSPFIIMIAFTMILMSVIVLVISYQRFDVLLRRARAAGGEVESEEISLTSSLATALSLGVSNLKKRPARTFLTIFTVTVLTFSIVTFVSVRGQDKIDLRPVSLDDDLEGRKIDPIPPKYTGVLFREFYWLTMQDKFVDAVKTEFGSRFDVAVRGHRIEVEGGNNAAREGKNQEKILFPAQKKTWIATGIMSFEPIERKFSHLHEAVSHNEWFRAEDAAVGRPADRNVIILPDNGAAQLGITEEMIFEKAPDGQWHRKPREQLPLIRLMNRNWRVIGILNTDLANRMRDVNGKSLAMVDYLRSAFASGAAGAGDLANEPQSYHMRWEDLVIVPWAAATDAKVKPRGVAVRLREPTSVTVKEGQTLADLAEKHLGHVNRVNEILEANPKLEKASDLEVGMEIRIPGDDIAAFRRDVALRINKSMYGQVENGRIALITTQSKQSVGGLAKIIVPVILCVLIVLNTMMANVEERRGEVGMLGAIGLSPSQISFLLLSESMVFSVMGIVMGTFIGLLFANVADAMGAFQSLSFNFTSLLSMALAMGTGVVVLVATLVPARRAAAMAAPSGMAQWELPEPSGGGNIRFDLPFTLTRGNAVGMMAFFRRFLLNHTDAASPDFNCRNIALDVIDSDQEQALVIAARMWLSPYDLDVAQDFVMKVVPTESRGVFSVVIQLHRTSGTEDAWLRTNYGFMDLVRRQFLLWRNLNNDARTDYIAEGAQLFQEAAR